MSFKSFLFISLICAAAILAETDDVPQNDEIIDRVVGGSAALKESSKITVLFKRASDNQNVCAGTLIKPTKVLTSAFCAKSLQVNNVKAVLYSLSAATPDSNAVVKKVLRIAAHPYYDPNYMMWDIAVITLDSAASNFAGLTIDSSASNLNGQRATALGWGYNRAPGSQNLQSATYSIFQANSQCANHYKNSYLNDANNFICLQANAVTSCSIDAGGPIMSTSGYLIGINYGLDCNVGRPSVALRLNDNWVKWINSQ